MDRRLKFSLYLLLFGILSLYVVLFRQTSTKQYSPAEVLGENNSLTLFVEPEDGRAPLLNYINSSHIQVLTEMYLLSDTDIINALVLVPTRGATISAILEEHPFGGNNLNQNTNAALESSGIATEWSSPSYTLTHEKAMVFDDQTVCILNMNLTKTAFTKNREYNICSINPEDVAEVEKIFQADWEKTAYEPTNPNLVVSPNNSRGKLTALINSAKSSLDMEMEVIEDPQIIDLLASKAQTLSLRVIEPDKKSVDNPPIPGVQVRYLSSPYPHAKLIIADYQRAYVGSVNLSSQSLDHNREVGILVSQPNILERLNATFTHDWNNAK